MLFCTNWKWCNPWSAVATGEMWWLQYLDALINNCYLVSFNSHVDILFISFLLHFSTYTLYSIRRFIVVIYWWCQIEYTKLLCGPLMHRASYLCWWFGKNSFADKHPTFHRSLAWVQTLDWTTASFQSKPGKCTSGKDHNFGLSRLWIWGNSGSLLRWKPYYRNN